MKKLVISLFTILSVIVTGLFVAFGSAQKKFAVAAEERYSRVLGENVVLYMDSSMTMPWFTLPYSYYVKVISVSGTAALGAVGLCFPLIVVITAFSIS